MPHHLDLYLKADSALHRLHPAAKLLGAVGFAAAALMTPVRPLWPAGALALMLAATAAAGRIPARSLLRRVFSLAVIIGGPFALSRLGGAETRAAGEVFAVRSLLLAGGFAVLAATTRAVSLIEVMGRIPVLSALSPLAELILRGADLLAEEVIHTHRAMALRGAGARFRVRLSGFLSASVSLIGRAAARSDRIGAAMVLRGFQGRFPAPSRESAPAGEIALGALYGAAAICLAEMGRWL